MIIRIIMIIVTITITIIIEVVIIIIIIIIAALQPGLRIWPDLASFWGFCALPTHQPVAQWRVAQWSSAESSWHFFRRE